jgi:hypothetical protein
MSTLDEYIKYNSGLIILISGLSGSNRSIVAKEIERDFKIKLISLDSYCKKNNDKIFELPNNKKITDWEHIDTYDWDKFNSDIEQHNPSGVVAYGDYFPTFKLKIAPDFHIHVKISKERLIEKRKEQIEKYPEKHAEMMKLINNDDFVLMVNKMIYPYYIEYRDKSKIDKYVNSDKNNTDELYEQVFGYIMFTMTKFLTEYFSTKKKNNGHYSGIPFEKPEKKPIHLGTVNGDGDWIVDEENKNDDSDSDDIDLDDTTIPD